MSYSIRYDDVRAQRDACNTQFDNWQTQMEGIGRAVGGIAGMTEFKGRASNAIKAYAGEIHGTLLLAVTQAITEFRTKLLLYGNGYYKIETDMHAELTEETIGSALTSYAGLQGQLNGEADSLASVLLSIRDIISIAPPGASAVNTDCDSFRQRADRLRNEAGGYERDQLRETAGLETLISSLKRAIAHYAGQSPAGIPYYCEGQYTRSADFANLCMALQTSMAYCNTHAGEVQAAMENQQAIADQLLAEERKNQAVWDIILSAAVIIAGVVVIVASGGLAAPLVVAGIAGTMLYSASNISEDIGVLQGVDKDPYMTAWNPIRDTVFGGSQTAYDIFGVVSGLVVPMGLGMQNAAAAGTSVARAAGVALAKQGLTMAAGYGADKAGEALGLSKEWRTVVSIGAMAATGLGVESLDAKLNVSGYYGNTGGVMPSDEAARVNGGAEGAGKKIVDVDNLPSGWTKTTNNGFTHVKDANGNIRVRIDPPDAKTPYPHKHLYDEAGNSLDINGNIVSPKSPDAHIPLK